LSRWSTIIGGGLGRFRGPAWQAASMGVPVTMLHEEAARDDADRRPPRPIGSAELVCSS
jgi:folate-dependent tRNA-U54 methylase TrmFO/GidA